MFHQIIEVWWWVMAPPHMQFILYKKESNLLKRCWLSK